MGDYPLLRYSLIHLTLLEFVIRFFTIPSVVTAARTIANLWEILHGVLVKILFWNCGRKSAATFLTADEAEEWFAAKPFEHMPGHPSLPIF